MGQLFVTRAAVGFEDVSTIPVYDLDYYEDLLKYFEDLHQSFDARAIGETRYDLAFRGIEVLQRVPGESRVSLATRFFEVMAKAEVPTHYAQSSLSTRAMEGSALSGSALRLLAEHGDREAALTMQAVYVNKARVVRHGGTVQIDPIWETGVSVWPFETAADEVWFFDGIPAEPISVDDELLDILYAWSIATQEQDVLSTAIVLLRKVSECLSAAQLRMIERGVVPEILKPALGVNGEGMPKALSLVVKAARRDEHYQQVLRELASGGWLSAQIGLASVLSVQDGIEALLPAAAAGHPLAQFLLADRYKEVGEAHKARAWACRSAAQGFALGMRLLACDLVVSSDDEEQLASALQLAQKAAQLGAPRSNIIAALAIQKSVSMLSDPDKQKVLCECLYRAIKLDRSQDALETLVQLSRDGLSVAKSALKHLAERGYLQQNS